MKLCKIASKLLLWCLLIGSPCQSQADESPAIALTQIGRYIAPGGIERAEIAAYNAKTQRIFAINPTGNLVDVLDIHQPDNPQWIFKIDLGGRPNSIAVHKGVVAVAIEATPKTNPGLVKFFDTDGVLLNTVVVGTLPDMLVFSPDGRWLLVANEGEPNSYNQPDSVDPEGSVSIIDMKPGAKFLIQSDVRTAKFTDAIPKINPNSIRKFGPNASLAQDLEPEYITVSDDSKTAWVTLQENNAIAVLDIRKGEFTKIVGLGFKDHSLPGNGLDASDQDGAISDEKNIPGINIRNWPVFGMYQPDGIASYRVHDKTYLVMANEGDTRNYTGFSEEIRVGTGGYLLDSVVFPNAAELKQNANLGRLQVTNATGNTDADPQFEKIMVPGARSFSIRRTDGTLVFDSGDELEQITAALVPILFNSDGVPVTTPLSGGFNTRSDNKGPEPESVALGKISGRTYAFIGLERTGGIVVYDISDPYEPFFVDYINTSPLDLAPEGLLFIKAKDSPNGRPLLVASHEISSTTSIYQINKLRRDDHDDDDEEDDDDHDDD